jgi:hypothetical protein
MEGSSTISVLGGKNSREKKESPSFNAANFSVIFMMQMNALPGGSHYELFVVNMI